MSELCKDSVRYEEKSELLRNKACAARELKSIAALFNVKLHVDLRRIR